jgi:hypothetical protein
LLYNLLEASNGSKKLMAITELAKLCVGFVLAFMYIKVTEIAEGLRTNQGPQKRLTRVTSTNLVDSIEAP